MKKCIIIINTRSGGSKKISFEKVEACLGKQYEYTRFTLPDDGKFDARNYDAVAVCGGDGTLSWVLNDVYDLPIDVYYFPSGTLNDKAKAVRYSHAKTSCPSVCDEPPKGKNIVIGMLTPIYENDDSPTNMSDIKAIKPNTGTKNDTIVFSYVLAAGTFTPIGYTAKVSLKKRIGVLAYIGEVLKEYKLHRIDADILADGRKYDGRFTLLMYLKSPRCFGFKFNKAFDAEKESGHFIAIRSPMHGGPIGDIVLFMRFFRVFFIGLKKPMDGNIIFIEASDIRVNQKGAHAYCRDGELQRIEGKYNVGFIMTKCRFSVIEKF